MSDNIGFRRQRWSSDPVKLLSYSPGDTNATESFTRAGTTATYFDVNGVLQATAANQKRDGHYIGGVRTLLIESAATNIVLSPRDLTNVAWVHTTMTPAKDQAGIDGVANSASSILATGANATSLQTITLASSTRAQQAWVKRLTGVGVVNMTMDNGVTWTAITVTASWAQVTIPSQAAVVNPVVGFRLVTSGDKIAVDYVDNETGTFSTSPVIGTRNLDDYRYVSGASATFSPRDLTLYAKLIAIGSTSGNERVIQFGNNTNVAGKGSFIANFVSPTIKIQAALKDPPGLFNTSSPGNTGVVGDTVEIRAVFDMVALTCTMGQSLNGAAESVGAASAVATTFSDWSVSTFYLGGLAGTTVANVAFISVKAVSGNQTMATMRTF